MLHIDDASLFAHRGLHDATRPRNSLSAFHAAADAGYGIELDVHISADGVPIVSHDADTLADTGHDLQIGATRASVLLALRFRDRDECLVSLEEVLRTLPTSTPVLIEIKPTHRMRETVAAVAGLVQGRASTTAVQSFDPRIVLAARRGMPGVRVGQLVDAPSADRPLLERLLWATMLTNIVVRPHFLAVHHRVVTTRVTRFWRRALRCPVLVWTVTDPAQAAACHHAGAGLIFEGFRPTR